VAVPLPPSQAAHLPDRRPAIDRRRAIAVGVVLALLMSLGAVLLARRAQDAHGRLSADDRAYLRLARDLHDNGNWADGGLQQPFRWAPGTPALLAAAATISGQPVDRDTAVATQAVVGTVLIAATFALGLALAGPEAALAAAAGVALYAPLLRAAQTAGTETLGALMIVLAALAIVLAVRSGRLAAFAGAGALLGAAALVRVDLLPAALLLPLAVGGARWRATRARRDGLTSAAAMLAGALVLVGPWSAFATSQSGHFVPVTDGGPANLFIGTYLPADGTLFGVKREFAAATRRVHPGQRHVGTYSLPQHLVLDAVAARHHGRTRDARLRAAAFDNLRRYALGRPLSFAAMEVRKLGRMWGRAYAGTGHRPGPLATWEHRLLAMLALAGLAAGLVRAHDRRLALLTLLILLTTAVDVAFVAEPRHAARLMPALLAAGAAGWWLAVRGSARTTDSAAARQPPATARART
jgi:hypothetical protein